MSRLSVLEMSCQSHVVSSTKGPAEKAKAPAALAWWLEKTGDTEDFVVSEALRLAVKMGAAYLHDSTYKIEAGGHQVLTTLKTYYAPIRGGELKEKSILATAIIDSKKRAVKGMPLAHAARGKVRVDRIVTVEGWTAHSIFTAAI